MNRMSKFIVPFWVLLFCGGIGFLVWSGRIPPESHSEMFAGIAFLLVTAIVYLMASFREEGKNGRNRQDGDDPRDSNAREKERGERRTRDPD